MSSPNNVPKMVTELIELTIDYVKGQTVVPLKRLGRFLGFGLLGAVFVALGLFLLNLGFLRYLQTLSSFEDTYSFAPYLIVIVADIAIIGVLFTLISRKSLIGEK